MKIKSNKIFKIIVIALCFFMVFEQSGFAQIAGEFDISGHLAAFRSSLVQDKFRPLHLRSLGYDNIQNSFRLLLDKGDLKNPKKPELEATTKALLNYFFVGISLPNDSFWVNLRPDAENNIIDSDLARTDVGRILLDADLQLKKDTAKFTSPETLEGKQYWNKLYQKAGALLGSENITIPTLTRPWIVPGDIIIRETQGNAYIYKATLKVMLEQDYLKDSTTYKFDDPRLKSLNEYSSQLIRELIIPKLTKEINTSKRYAPLRQVYYSLILAQWFKSRFYGKGGTYSSLINKRELQGLTSKASWSKAAYFREYQKSFKDGEYNIKEPVYTPYGQAVRSYFSGGVSFGNLCKPDSVIPGKVNHEPLSKGTLPTVLVNGGDLNDLSAGNIQSDAAAPDSSYELDLGLLKSYPNMKVVEGVFGDQEFMRKTVNKLFPEMSGQSIKKVTPRKLDGKGKYLFEGVVLFGNGQKKSVLIIVVEKFSNLGQVTLPAYKAIMATDPDAEFTHRYGGEKAIGAGGDLYNALVVDFHEGVTLDRICDVFSGLIRDDGEPGQKKTSLLTTSAANLEFSLGQLVVYEVITMAEKDMILRAKETNDLVALERSEEFLRHLILSLQEEAITEHFRFYRKTGYCQTDPRRNNIVFRVVDGKWKFKLIDYDTMVKINAQKDLIKFFDIFEEKTALMSTVRPWGWTYMKDKSGFFESILKAYGRDKGVDLLRQALNEIESSSWDWEKKSPIIPHLRAFLAHMEQDLGAQVSNVKNLNQLLRIINVLRKSKDLPQISKEAKDKEIIEFCIKELRKQGLVEETVDRYGNQVIKIKIGAVNNRIVQAMRKWAINPQGGVKAINFQGADGNWVILGFTQELNDLNTLEHEQKEIAYRKQGLSWIEAHNKVVEETRLGQKIDKETAEQYKAGRQDEVGAGEDKAVFYRLGKTEQEFSNVLTGALRKVLGSDRMVNFDISKLSEADISNIVDEFLIGLRARSLIVTPLFEKTLKYLLTKEQIEDFSNNLGHFDRADFVLVLQRIHTFVNGLVEFGFREENIELLSLAGMISAFPLSNAQKLFLLQKFGFAGNSWDNLKPNPEIIRLLNSGKIEEVIRQLYNKQRYLSEVLPDIKAIAVFFGIDMERLANVFVLGIVLDLQNQTGKFFEKLDDATQKQAALLVAESIIKDISRIIVVVSEMQRQKIKVKKFLARGFDGIVLKAEEQGAPVVVKINIPQNGISIDMLGKTLLDLSEKTKGHRNFVRVREIFDMEIGNLFSGKKERVLVELNDFISGPTLKRMLVIIESSPKALTQTLALLLQFLEMHKSLMSIGLTNRDIGNLNNAIVDEEGVLKWVDFGNIVQLNRKEIKLETKKLVLVAIKILIGQQMEDLDKEEEDHVMNIFVNRFGKDNRLLGEGIFKLFLRAWDEENFGVNELINGLNNLEKNNTDGSNFSVDRGFAGGLKEIGTQAFNDAWKNGEEITISPEHLKVLQDPAMGSAFRTPEVRLISREEMDSLAKGENVIRVGGRVLVVNAYWSLFIEQEKLDVLIHEAMSDWLERERPGINPEDVPIDLEGIKSQEAERRARHRGEKQLATEMLPDTDSFAAKNTSVEVPLRHVNRQNAEIILPKDRFGAEVNIINLMKDLLKSKLGEIPLISIIGSLSYAFDENGRIMWDIINDLDIRVHTDKLLSDQEYNEIKFRLFDALRKSGVNVFTPEVNNPDDSFRKTMMQLWGIVDSAGKVHEVHLINAGTKVLFSDKEGLGSYHAAELFFGDTEMLNKALKAEDVDSVVEKSALYYERAVQEVKDDMSQDYSDSDPKPLKRLYQAAYILGKEAQFRWLLERYKQLCEKYDDKLFRDSCGQALKQLDMDKELLRVELRKQNSLKNGSIRDDQARKYLKVLIEPAQRKRINRYIAQLLIRMEKADFASAKKRMEDAHKKGVVKEILLSEPLTLDYLKQLASWPFGVALLRLRGTDKWVIRTGTFGARSKSDRHDYVDVRFGVHRDKGGYFDDPVTLDLLGDIFIHNHAGAFQPLPSESDISSQFLNVGVSAWIITSKGMSFYDTDNLKYSENEEHFEDFHPLAIEERVRTDDLRKDENGRYTVESQEQLSERYAAAYRDLNIDFGFISWADFRFEDLTKNIKNIDVALQSPNRKERYFALKRFLTIVKPHKAVSFLGAFAHDESRKVQELAFEYLKQSYILFPSRAAINGARAFTKSQFAELRKKAEEFLLLHKAQDFDPGSGKGLDLGNLGSGGMNKFVDKEQFAVNRIIQLCDGSEAWVLMDGSLCQVRDKKIVSRDEEKIIKDIFLSNFNFSDSGYSYSEQKLLKLPLSRVQFLHLGNKQPPVVIDGKYYSIVVNMDVLKKLMARQKEYKVFDWIVQAAIQTDALRKTNFYAQGKKAGFLKAIFPRLREKVLYHELVSSGRRYWTIVTRNPNRPLSRYIGIRVVNIPDIKPPIDNKEGIFNDYINSAVPFWVPIRQSYISTIFASFSPEIEKQMVEIKNRIAPNSPASVWELLLCDGSFSEAVKQVLGEFYNMETSFMFRYPSGYNWLSRNSVTRTIKEYKKTGKTQVINIGIVGASYGQEPISVAIVFGKKIRELARENGIPEDAVRIKIHVLSKPGRIFEKLQNNQIIYPAGLEVSSEDRDLYFKATEKGLVRSDYLNDILSFHEVDLIDDATYAGSLPKLDILLVHNVLQYIKPVLAEEPDFQSKVERMFDYMAGILKEGGIFSYANEGDGLGYTVNQEFGKRFYWEKDKQAGKESAEKMPYYYWQVEDYINDLVVFEKKTGNNQGTSVINKQNDKGGIDFRVLPVVNQPINTVLLKLNTADFNRLNSVNLDSEWAQMQNMINADIVPSNERIKEYVQASCLRQDLGNQVDKVLGCIADILRMEEDRVLDTDAQLREMLALIESDKSIAELDRGLNNIVCLPQELK